MTSAGRSVGYGLVLSLALVLVAFLLDRSADPVIDEFEKVIVPCQHGGEWVSAAETCRCLGPWTGKYCGECACENGGVCDTNNIQVATPGTLWGCRCPDRLVGALCEQCNANLTEDGRCAGPCKAGFTGPDCNRFCSETPTFDEVVLNAEGQFSKELELLDYGGELHVCSGHGACDPTTGYCECAPFYFPSEDGRSSCARTCLVVDGKLCAGHGQCGETGGVVSCACEFGYHLAPACDVACPGMDIDYIGEPCAGRGTCYLESAGAAKCECGDIFVGEACQFRCPTGAIIESSEACSGHGVCRVDDSEGYSKAVCDCEDPFEGPGCGCTRAITCSGHGECRGDGTCACDVDPLFGKPLFRGERCNKCIPGHYGSDCRLQCTTFEPADPAFVFEEGRSIHCHGRGTCAVANFGLADESVVCGACTGNFATESHCEECKDNFYPKFSVMGGDETASCTTFANRATCNGAGEPKDTFGRKTNAVEPQCDCDAPHADALSFCTECELSYYPSNLREDPKGACSRRCVDKTLLGQGLPVSVPHIETLECVNDGVCADDGLSCLCVDGYSGVDCGIACGAPDESGKQCSGHGRCVSNVLQQLLEFEANVKGFTASRCECSPQDEVTEAERLAIFRGELVEETGEALAGRNKRDWYGDTCGYGCLAAPWKDGLECNGEECEVFPISDDAGTPILTCTQDSQCGEYDSTAKILKFYDASGSEKTELTSDESKLRGAVSLSRRWSKRTGPFCHVPNTPLSVSVANMKCVQRINKDGEEADKEVECNAYVTRHDCLHKGEGACKYVDVCKAALEEFDTWSYCYELMRTQEPPALRSKVCAESCTANALTGIQWGQKCNHFRNRLPSDVCPTSNFRNVDELCDMADDAPNATNAPNATSLVHECENALPPTDVVFDDSKLATPMDAADTSAYCWETSDQPGSVTYPFKFSPLLDTAEARHLQSSFHSLFRELGSRDTCVADSRVDYTSCANIPKPDGAQANVLYLCTSADTSTSTITEVTVLERTDKTAEGVKCEALPTALDVSPFEMVCPDSGVEALSEVGLEDAVSLAARRGCALRAKSALHAESVAVTDSEAMSVCKAVLDAASPSACEQACGPDDVCSDLGTTHDGKRVLQCRRPDASDVGIDPATGKCDNCLLGDCSITGREGGAEYRCVVPATGIATSATPPTFAPCDDTLLLHLDELGGGKAHVSSVQGQRDVRVADADETVDETVDVYDVNADASHPPRRPPRRVEFDVRLGTDGRGRVAVLGSDGTLVSLLLHYYGGFGYDVNAPLTADPACDAGEEDNCKFVVAPGTTYRVVMTLDWTARQVTVKFADQAEVTRDITADAGDFVGVAVSGTARVSQMWVFSNDSASCASLHRLLGRSLTMQASHIPVADSPPNSMSFCAGVEKAMAGHVAGCAHERDAVFAVPWHDYCAYAEHLQELTSTGDCGAWSGNYDLAVKCEPVLSKFTTPTCARSAVGYDWETNYCVPLRNDTRPDELVTANCSSECIAKVVEDDFAQLCDDRDDYWDATTGKAKPDFLPDECTDNGKWKDVDWIRFCTDKAENQAEGYCSSTACDCRGQGGWMAGDACELECPMANDYSPCSEESMGGACLYRRKDTQLADAFYEDPDNNKIKNHPVMQIQGRCSCVHPDALAEEGCKVECKAKDDTDVCNTNKYNSGGEQWDISACDAGGSGVCRCMAPLARMTQETVSNWKGQSVDILKVEFGNQTTAGTAFPNMSAFRLYAHQGAKELMMRYFGAGEFTWEDTKFKFESSPADFKCGDAKDRDCDFHDVVIAQSLYSSSSFYGGSCSRRCPGVDTGEEMVERAEACDEVESAMSGTDLVSEEGCKSECLDDFRCKFSKWDSATSKCDMYRECKLNSTAPNSTAPNSTAPRATETWREKKLTGSPNLTPCSGRGQCGLTGQCQCDPAKLLSLTDPITGEKNLIPSNKRGGFTSTPITTLDLTGYRGDACEKVCPGYDETKKSMADVCSGHGVCTRSGTCQCDVNYVGLNCELRCPVKDIAAADDQTVCAGHGTCSEARIFAGYDATEEDSRRYYMVTEAYRKWYNECPTNTDIDYFVLPFETFPGSVASKDIVGGPDCVKVPQEQDNPNEPYVKRPEIKLDGLSDYQFLDDEKALNSDTAIVVEGTSEFSREGMFRRRYWYEEGEVLKEQTLFVENYARVKALYNESAVAYDKFYGYRCGAEMEASLQPTSAVETVADCASLCRALSDCGCFHYREFYHRRFRGECVLGKAGPLVAFPVVKVAYIHTTNGFLQKLEPTSPNWAQATPTPFEAFDETFVQLHQSDAFPASCRAPTSSLGTNVASVRACAALCADANTASEGCAYFSYDPFSRRCLQVRTTSAECVEGMTPNPAGFYAVSLANTGAIAPTAYTRSGSARIFPTSVTTRGTYTGTYIGRARPGYETAIASCDCLSNAAWGFWDGHRCHTCQKHYGSRTCSRRCPGITAADEPCFGYGKCLWGSVDGEGEEFYEARCLCGDPAAPYVDDLATVGVWEVEEFELHVKATFNGLPPSEAHEDPRNYNFASSTCSGCKEGFGGLNCASTCSYCLFGGACSFTPSTVSISVPCTCVGNDYDSYNSCCPTGFSMLESLVHNDVSLLTTSLRRKRLMQEPGVAVIMGKFYDSAIFPNLEESENPSRRWCAPGPGMFETEWLKSDALKKAHVCAGEGTVRDRGLRKLVVGATPAKYSPQFCTHLGSDAEGYNYWKSLEMTLWYTYPGKIFLSSLGDHTSSMAYTENGVPLTDADGDVSPPYSTANYTFEQFAKACKSQCTRDSCNGIVIRENSYAYDCFVASHVFLGAPHSAVFDTLPDAKFTALRKQRQPEFCENVEDSSKTCVLGATGYGTVPLCSEMSLGDANGDTGSTVLNLGKQCQVNTQGDTWIDVDASLCALFPEERVRVNEETDVLSRLVPNANALLFGAYGNTKFEASAGEMLSNVGVMRPENPCSVLPGDYFWNKDDRTQCISASTDQTCDIKDWQHCANYELTEQALTYVHSAVESQGTYPHRVTVLGEDHEVFLTKPNYQYRIIPFDPAEYDAILSAHDAAASTAEIAKQDEIDALTNRINFLRADTGSYGDPYVFEWGTDIVDMSDSAVSYSFYKWVIAGLGMHPYISAPQDSVGFDPLTWPREQIQGCISWNPTTNRNYGANLNAAKCLPMGLQQLYNATKQIYDSVKQPFDDFFLTERVWPLDTLRNQLLVNGGIMSFWHFSHTDYSFYGTRLMLMCVYEHSDCHLLNLIVEGTVTHEHTFEKCYTTRVFNWGAGYEYRTANYYPSNANTFDVIADADVCPSGCSITPPSGSENCWTCKDGGGPCIITETAIVPGTNCLNTCNAEKLADYKTHITTNTAEHGQDYYSVDTLYRPYGEDFISIEAAKDYSKIESVYDAVKTELAARKAEKTTLQTEWDNLRNANTEERRRLLLEKDNAEADSIEASCTESNPCDICQGHCWDNDNECREGLVCVDAASPRADAIRLHCGGTADDEYTDYCLPTDWETSNVELYVAGAMTAPNVVSTWLVEVGSDETSGITKPFAEKAGQPYGKGTFDECVHDCNNDFDCLPHLKCYHRDGTEPVPGCHGSIPNGHNACYNPTASLKVLATHTRTEHTINVHKDVVEARAMPSTLMATSPDYVTDKFEIKGNVHSSGIAGTQFPYGHAPWFLPKDMVSTYGNSNAAGSIPLCGGDCDGGQCMPGLECFQRETGETIPGCTGTPSANDADYCYNPYTATGKAPPRALLTVTAEQCAQMCEKTHGCTAAHWEKYKCYLFHFDASLGCSLFEDLTNRELWQINNKLKDIDLSNTNDNAVNLPHCKGDCESWHGNCAAGLKCFETDTNDRVPGCKGSTGAGDVCYDPAKIIMGFVKNPNACQLCKHHGLFAHVDAAYSNSDFFSEEILCAHEDREAEYPKICAVLPKLVDNKYIWDWWSADGWWNEYESSLIPWHAARCTPTRAGVESTMYSNTMFVGKQFLESPYMILRAHPEVTTFSQCELACGSDDLCRAWQFDEDFDSAKSEITYNFAKSAVCQDSDLAWMLSHYPSHSHASFGDTKVAVKLTYAECKALCDSRSSCTGFRMHTGTNAAGDNLDRGVGCEIFKGSCTTTVDASATDYNPCPPTNPELHKWSVSNDYWCYSSYPNSPCRMSNSDYPPPAGYEWGQNQVDCKIWQYWLKSYKGVHTCKLFDFAPQAMPTSNIAPDTFSASTRVGFVERDFSPKIAFFDDGEHPACDCFEGSTAYNCACLDESFVPYSSKPTDSVYGCAGHGRCSSLEYKCVCDDGYAWIWGDSDAAADTAGHTCRECAAGTFKDKSVATCTRCPAGKYQDEMASSDCKLCPLGFATTTAGASSVSRCMAKTDLDCKVGFFNLVGTMCLPCLAGYYTDRRNAVACKPCAAGRYNANAEQSECAVCPEGYFQDNETSLDCKACETGKFSVEGSSECVNAVCDAGQFTPTLVTSDCEDCPIGFFQTSSMAFSCESCPEGYYQEMEKSVLCTECPAGWTSLREAMLCTETAVAESAEEAGAEV